jgi:putative DNA primase/helicase
MTKTKSPDIQAHKTDFIIILENENDMKEFSEANSSYSSNFSAEQDRVQPQGVSVSSGNGEESELKVNSDDLEFYENDSKLPKPAAVVAWLQERYQGKWIWNSTSKSWFAYDDALGIWIELDSESIEGLVQNELDANPLTQHNYGSSYVADILNLLKNRLKENSWNSQPRLIPLRNGVLNLVNQELLPISPDYRFTWCLPYDYNPDATCEPIQAWLLETMQGDQQLVQLLRAYMNAVIKGRSDLQRFLECIGEGGTGKSTFANLVIALVGTPNTLSSNLKTLETNRFESANLLGKRLVYIADSERYTGNISTLKALTGEDQIRYEKKYVQGGDCFCFDGMVLIVANEAIQFNDHTGGIRRRRITVPFNHRVKPEDRRNLIKVTKDGVSGEFASYIPGLMNWVLAMPDDEVTELVKNTHRSVPSLAISTAETLIETNPMASWLDDCVVIELTAKTYVGNKDQPSSTHLYPSYVSYCASNGYKPVSSTRFSSLLLGLLQTHLDLAGVKKEHDRNGNYITHLRLRVNSEDTPRPITGVMDGQDLGEVSEIAEIPMNASVEGCEGSDNNSISSHNFETEL